MNPEEDRPSPKTEATRATNAETDSTPVVPCPECAADGPLHAPSCTAPREDHRGLGADSAWFGENQGALGRRRGITSIEANEVEISTGWRPAEVAVVRAAPGRYVRVYYGREGQVVVSFEGENGRPR